MKKIISIEKYKGKTFQINFENEDPAFLNHEIIFDFKLRSGLEINDDEWEKIIYANNFRRAKERALYLFDYHDYSYSALFKRLHENYDEEICYDVCDKLAELGIINDRRYAEALARKYVEIKLYGFRRASQEMKIKGLSKEIINEALEPYEDTVCERLTALVEKKYIQKLDDEESIKKVKNALIRAGYSYDEINYVIKNVLGDL